MPTDAQIRETFAKIIDQLPEKYKVPILERYKREDLLVITDENKFPDTRIGRIHKVGTIGGKFYFRLSELTDADLNKAILHELLHSYIEVRDNLQWIDFQDAESLGIEHQMRARVLRQRVEREVIELTEVLQKQLQL